jgi:hypothetical protein
LEIREKHLKRFYTFLGEVRERFYVPPNPKQIFKEGNELVIARSPAAEHHKVSEEKVRVLARYFTQNQGFKNYGMVVQILEGDKKGKILHLPSVFSIKED